MGFGGGDLLGIWGNFGDWAGDEERRRINGVLNERFEMGIRVMGLGVFGAVGFMAIRVLRLGIWIEGGVFLFSGPTAMMQH